MARALETLAPSRGPRPGPLPNNTDTPLSGPVSTCPQTGVGGGRTFEASLHLGLNIYHQDNENKACPVISSKESWPPLGREASQWWRAGPLRPALPSTTNCPA